MTHTLAQPNATPLSDSLVAALLARVYGEDRTVEPAAVRFHDMHSNDVAEVLLDCGRTLMVKRGRYDWAVERFETSRAASELIRERTDLVVPAPLDIPLVVDALPVEAYWRIRLPTLQEIWPGLSASERADALRSWGALATRVHRIRLAGHGALQVALAEPRSLEEHLEADIGERLLPAVEQTWPAAAAGVAELLEHVPELAERSGAGGGVLLHNDLHMGNVLCETSGGQIRCVGLLDLETAAGGPAESDLAIAQVQHGPLLGQPLEEGWFSILLEGYGLAPDPFALGFYRGYHLANLGYYAALVGHAEHAAGVAAALAEEVAFLRGAAV